MISPPREVGQEEVTRPMSFIFSKLYFLCRLFYGKKLLDNYSFTHQITSCVLGWGLTLVVGRVRARFDIE
jgi:hypothetical protein